MSSVCCSGMEAHLPQVKGEERKKRISCWAFVGPWCGPEFPGVCISLVKMQLSLCREQKAVKVELEI